MKGMAIRYEDAAALKEQKEQQVIKNSILILNKSIAIELKMIYTYNLSENNSLIICLT